MKILVFGGSGFVGSALVPALLTNGWSVTLANRGNRPVHGTNQIILDRDDDFSVSALGNESAPQFDIVIDLSAYTGSQVKRARHALQGKAGRWIHLSSAAVYTDNLDHAPHETDPIGGAPIWGTYGVEKSDADSVLLTANDHIPTIILRPPYLYGPGNDNDRETFIFARAITDRPIIIPGNGAAPLQFLHIADLASSVVNFIRESWYDSNVYNIAEPQIISTSDWVDLLCNIAGHRPLICLGGVIDPESAPRSYFPFRNAPCVVDVTSIACSRFTPPSRPLLQGFDDTFKSYDINSLRNLSPTTLGETSMLSRMVR